MDPCYRPTPRSLGVRWRVHLSALLTIHLAVRPAKAMHGTYSKMDGVCGARGAKYHEKDYQDQDLKHVEGIPEVAGVEGAGADRGHAFYDYDSKESSIVDVGKSSDMTLGSNEEVHRSSASSMETSEKKIRKRTYRDCVPCPMDMIRKFTNLGIKWICGAYQRARRSFKSECMMRFRNCQDGTLFVKVADRKCNDDSYHGRHWFYVYKV